MLLFVSIFLNRFAFAEPVKDSIVEKAVSIIENNYLWESDLDANDALIEAAEAAEDAISWLIVEPGADGILLKHGEKGSFAMLPKENLTYQTLPAELDELKNLILAGPAQLNKIEGKPVAIDAELDLSVELLKGVSRQLDRFSVVMHKEKLRRFNERIRGRLSGIGCRVQAHPKGLRILEVFPEGPAEDIGILSDDVITHIDGGSIKGQVVSKGVERLRGESGSSVKVTVERSGQDPFDLSLVRRSIRVPNVRWRVEKGVGVIRIESFSRQTSRFLRQALADFRFEKELSGIVIDLRGNSGGSMIQACRSVDLFLTEGYALKTVGREGRPVPKLLKKYPLRKGNEPQVPVVVLINGRSASAAEILAGALRLGNRALLIGQKTYGKGVVQMPYSLRKGGVQEQVTLKLTVAQYLLMDEFSVHEEGGVEPHLWMTPITFRKGRVRIPSENRGHVYALEKEGWRQTLEEPLRADYLLDFALRLLRQNPPAALPDLNAYAEDFAEELQPAEWQRLSDAFAVKGIDWQGGESLVESNADLRVEIETNMKPKAGEEVEVVASICNSGKSPLFRSSVLLQTDGGPWRNIVIPIGHVPAGQTVKGRTTVKLSSTNRSRADHLTPIVRAQGIEPIPMNKKPITLEGLQPPLLDAIITTDQRSDKTMRLEVLLTNRENRTLKDVDVRLGLPNTKSVEFLTDGQVSFEQIEAGQSQKAVFDISITKRLDGLGKFELRVDSDGFRRALMHSFKSTRLLKKIVLSPPSIDLNVPVETVVGQQTLELSFKDDGLLKEGVVWMDGEKIAWTSSPKTWSVPLQLDAGVHEILVEATDDSGLSTTRRFRVLTHRIESQLK